MAVDIEKFKSIFVSEVEDQLEILNKNTLVLEKKISAGKKTIDNNILNELMRASHTIKGSSASMGFTKMAFLTHVMEDIFDAGRNKKLQITEDIINKIFKAVDNIDQSLSSIKENSSELDFGSFSDELKEMAGVNTVGVGKSVRNQEESTIPEDEKISVQKEEKIAKSDKGEERSDGDDMTSAHVVKIDYIKVPVKRLDTLLDLVEELLIDKMRIEQLSSKIEELKQISGHISLLISGIQYEVMQARLVPVEQVFARFPRMVRDLAQKQKKRISFNISGGEIELDRTVVDKLGEPLIHLLRNAVDHGIEKEGQIKLEAKRKSERVLFVVENDGLGIDIEKVKATAIKRGLATPKEIESIEENKLIEFLFNPNFSTSEKVTEISGRGVGLSVVKKFVESFGGRVLVENSKNSVRFILELPLTIAIIESLLVNVDKHIFAIPFNNIERSVVIKTEDIKRMGDHDMAVVDGINVPLVDLRKVFHKSITTEIDTEASVDNKNIKKAKAPGSEKKKSNQTSAIKNTLAVLVRKENSIAGIVIDSLVSEQEIIVKPFSSVLQGIKGFSGSTILGDGNVVLILDVINLLKYINTKAGIDIYT